MEKTGKQARTGKQGRTPTGPEGPEPSEEEVATSPSAPRAAARVTLSPTARDEHRCFNPLVARMFLLWLPGSEAGRPLQVVAW